MALLEQPEDGVGEGFARDARRVTDLLPGAGIVEPRVQAEAVEPFEVRRQPEGQDMLDEVRPDDVGRNVFIGMPGSVSAEQLERSGEYEHLDESGIVYPIGYAEHAKEIYGRARVPYERGAQ